jgi:hypothetical protein
MGSDAVAVAAFNTILNLTRLSRQIPLDRSASIREMKTSEGLRW